MLNFKPAFSLSSFTLIKRLLIALCFLSLGWIICISEVIDISLCSLGFSFSAFGSCDNDPVSEVSIKEEETVFFLQELIVSKGDKQLKKCEQPEH